MFFDSFLKKIKSKKIELVIFTIIIATGIFLRSYNFSDWLHFELDQAYDFNVVSPAVENGMGNLPLLGTNVGAGTLRLGPAFYYMEYVSAKIFGNTPQGHAMLTLLLNIAALPFFYLLCRRYFSKIISLGLLAIFSVSFYSVMYSRFSWSPNVLPFLIIFSFYALLRSVSSKEKHPSRWFLICAAAIAITSQIHLNSFLVIPPAALLFIAIKRPRFNWKVWLSALAIIFIIYSPVVLNDIKTHGQNFEDFKKKFQKISTKKALPIETTAQTIEYNAYEYFFINTANDQINGTILKDFGFSCDSCHKNLSIKISSIIFFLLALAILLVNIFKEKNEERKNFLLLAILWFSFSFYLFFTIAEGYEMYPRFFLIVSPLAIIFYGFIFSAILPKKTSLKIAIFLTVIIILIFTNTTRIIGYFNQLKEGEKGPLDKLEVADIFPNTQRVTLSQQRDIAKYIASIVQKNGHPAYISVENDYKLSLWQILEKEKVSYYDGINKNRLQSKANYFYILPSNSNFDPNASFFMLVEKRYFGSLAIYYMEANPDKISFAQQNRNEKTVFNEICEEYHLPPPMTWNEFFEK